MAKIEITLKPRFNSAGNVSGWEVSNGKDVAVNASHKDAEKAWSKSVLEYQAAGFTVDAKAFASDGKSIEAHGTYFPGGSRTDHGPKPARSSEALPGKSRSPSKGRSEALPAPKPSRAKKKAPARATSEALPAASKAKATSGGKRKAGAPTAYQVFVKRRLPELHSAGYANKDAMRQVGKEWSAKKRGL